MSAIQDFFPFLCLKLQIFREIEQGWHQELPKGRLILPKGGAGTETKLLQELQNRVLYLPTHVFHMIRFL